MRSSLLISTTVFGLALAAAAHAQPTNSVTQFPPAPNSAAGAPQPANSLPTGSGTGTVIAPGNALGGQTPTGQAQVGPSAPGMNTLHPLRQPRRAPAHVRPRHRPAHPAHTSTNG